MEMNLFNKKEETFTQSLFENSLNFFYLNLLRNLICFLFHFEFVGNFPWKIVKLID